MTCNILLTGSNGFIGKALDKNLIRQGHAITRVIHQKDDKTTSGEYIACDIGNELNLQLERALNKTEIVIHLAARAHILNEIAVKPLAEYRLTNTIGTTRLAEQAALRGVKRFIFLSSIGVNGNSTFVGQPFSEKKPPAPHNDYAISKWEAEKNLVEVSRKNGMEFVIIRPPLVYGPEVKANFLQLLEWIYKGIPLPLNSIRNKRSFLYIDNLVDILSTCIDHPAAANQLFLASDGKDLSIAQLVKQLSWLLGKKNRLFSVPPRLLKFFLFCAGKRELAVQICESLQVDNSKTRKMLNWNPVCSIEQGLEDTARWFIKSKQSSTNNK